MRRLARGILLAALCVGCGEAMGGADGGALDSGRSDGGGTLDAAVTLDGSVGEDAGTLEDAGGLDAGDPDAGDPTDGGAGEDAGLLDGGPGDAGAPDAGTDGGPLDAGTGCLATDLVIAAIDPGAPSGPGAGSIAIFNASGSAVAIDATDYALREDPDVVLLRNLQSGVTIPAGGIHRFPYPAAFSDGNASGEMALYREDLRDDPVALLDFVCWGFGHSAMFSVRSVAQADGDWSGGCVSGISGPELRRITGTDGRARASYDPTGLTPLFTCF